MLNVNDKNKQYTLNINVDKITAPIKYGDKVGEAEIVDNEGKIIGKVGITVKNDVTKASLWDYYKRNLNVSLGGKTI